MCAWAWHPQGLSNSNSLPPACRFMRLGTASLLGDNSGPFIGVDRLDLRRYAGRPSLARVLCDYILYHDHNPRKALELCAHATKATNFEVGRAGST